MTHSDGTHPGDAVEHWRQSIGLAADLEQLEAVRVSLLGKKGYLAGRLQELPKLDPAIRRQRGAELNLVKSELIQAITDRHHELERQALDQQIAQERLDMTLPAPATWPGRLHPTSQTITDIIAFFTPLGFAIADGPDIESEFYNFTALNMPADHPARQMQDTFYLSSVAGTSETMLLRTHTSPVQIRTMLGRRPPLRVLAPGRVYRCDYDLTHTPVFHQVEGLVVDKSTHMGELKGCLIDFCRDFFGLTDLPVRFRPSYFPFTEPSAEIDIACERNGDRLVITNSGDQWLEIGGCGMVHPQVLTNCGIDPQIYQGFAFGVGVERLAMLKHGLPDLRAFFEADIRWLEYYGFPAG